MLKRLFFLFAAIAVLSLTASAQSAATGTIADYLQRVTGGRVTVHQPSALNQRLNPANGDSTNVATLEHALGGKNVVGYRIQVFSDRNQRTAKGEALTKERSIKEACPEMGTYITYDAPSWRLRVGDFRTRDEAVIRLGELREMFPGYAGEMIIVVDVINTLPQ